MSRCHQPPGWFVQFRLILQRNYRSYVRNYGNVLARIMMNLMVAIVGGLVFKGMGRNTGIQKANDTFGR